MTMCSLGHQAVPRRGALGSGGDRESVSPLDLAPGIKPRSQDADAAPPRPDK